MERPTFYLGTSVDDCCEQPNVQSVLVEGCMSCEFRNYFILVNKIKKNQPFFPGTLTADRITPLHVALYPPNDLELEVTASGYETVSWLINGTAMHDFERLELEDYNKRLIISNTTYEDIGIYSADIHTLQNESEVIIIDFFVYKYGRSYCFVQTVEACFSRIYNYTIFTICDLYSQSVHIIS